MSEPLVPGVSYGEFLAEAERHRSEASFRASPFFAGHGESLAHLLSTPRLDLRPQALPDTRPLRLVHWNIEKGKGLAGLRHYLTTDLYLSGAAIWCLNEVDHGMARAGANADVARELAEALNCSSVYLPSYIECTKGTEDDLLFPGENTLGLHGMAILTRLPVRDVHVTILPPCHDYFDFFEKRFGHRQGLFVRLGWGDQDLIVGTTHLEVRNTPQCRARQFAQFLQGLKEARQAWGLHLPVVLTGDWNTNTFRRGSFGNSAREFLRIVSTRPAKLDHELLHPFAREPLFALLREAGLSVDSFNDETPTASQEMGTVEDLRALPSPVASAVARLFHLRDRTLRMRLDWIAATGVRAVSAPWTRTGLRHDGRRVSDHAPIGVELESGYKRPPPQ